MSLVKRKKVVVKGPALTQSGYGHHTRFVLSALKEHQDEFDVFCVPTQWGQTGWIHENGEFRKWLDNVILKTNLYLQNRGEFDVSLQVTIPNEWQKMAPINVGVTAGIETTKVAPVWLEKGNLMDHIITVSEHSKQVYEMTKYQAQHSVTKQPVELELFTDIDVVHYPHRLGTETIDLELDFDFNYLMVAQWGPRKNMERALRWWLEENFDNEVGLVLKTSVRKNCTMDRHQLELQLQNFLHNFEDRKCKVYLLHGDMSNSEMDAIYRHPKIKAMLSATHGEGFGLPLFEAAYNGLPVVAPGWSGHCDFLYSKNEKGKVKPLFLEVDYELGQIPKDAHWEGVLQADSMWSYAQEGSFKMKVRQVRTSNKKWQKKAEILQKYLLESFTPEIQNAKMIESIKSVL